MVCLASNIIHLNGSNFSDTIANNKPTLVDFWADWCAPCHMMAPVVESLAEKYRERIVFAKLDVDENPAIAQAYGIEAIPTFVLFFKGQPVERAVGAVGKNGLEQLLNKAPKT